MLCVRRAVYLLGLRGLFLYSESPDFFFNLPSLMSSFVAAVLQNGMGKCELMDSEIN